jgi:alkanesulfonate monooxygenase SsuD/methylene tetrahydromethanopterin reductase-like flavin-dependent oxidoreductase (luciferase family)
MLQGQKGVTMLSRPIRLGISLAGQCPVAQLLVEARRAEQIGFDVVSLVDHLGCTAPFTSPGDRSLRRDRINH